MAKIYYRLILSGNWNIEDVPMLWKSEVEALLAESNAA